MNKILIFILLTVGNCAFAQNLVSSSSKTIFYSSATLEDITAVTTKGKSAINVTTGEIVFSIPINSFEFDKSLMQEHFNEKYMESEKFPKATFTGQIEQWENNKSIDKAVAIGTLTIHGVSKKLSSEGSVTFNKDKLIVMAKFNVRLEDFEVEVPSIILQKIAEVVEITINYEYPIDEK